MKICLQTKVISLLFYTIFVQAGEWSRIDKNVIINFSGEITAGDKSKSFKSNKTD